MPFDASTIAQELGKQDNLPPDAFHAEHRSVRHLLARAGSVPLPDPLRTATSARIYPPIELARIRILLDAVKGGVGGDNLTAVISCLQARPRPFPVPPSMVGGIAPKTALEAAVKGTAAGENWILRLVGTMVEGVVTWRAYVEPDAPVPAATRRAERAQGHVRFVETRFPISERIRPFVGLIIDGAE